MPHPFPNPTKFDAEYSLKACWENKADNVKRLRIIIGAFSLRRTEADVQKHLSPKTELTLTAKLTSVQLKAYKKVLERNMNCPIQALRQAADHPYVIKGMKPDKPFGPHAIQASGKMKVLDALLT